MFPVLLGTAASDAGYGTGNGQRLSSLTGEVLGISDELKTYNVVSGPTHSVFPETGSSSSALAG